MRDARRHAKAGANRTHSHATPALDAQAVYHLLTSRGYRLTSSRKNVIYAFLNSREPLSIQDVVRRTSSADPATVYRILHMLMKEGIVSQVRLPGAPALYELVRHHHHHIVCITCGRVEHIPCHFVDTRAVQKESSFAEIIDHDVLFSGRCGQCA